MTKQYLVVFDADKIKEYVFATGRLKEIRGASEQVRTLTDRKALETMLRDLNATSSAKIIYAGGGAGALCFDDEQAADAFCLRLERTYRRTTGSATLSAVAVPIDPDHPYESLEDAQQRLAQRKSSRPQAEYIPGGGFIRFCDSDRHYPASRKTDPNEGEGELSRQLLLSASSKTKRECSRHYRRNFLASPFWHTFSAMLADDTYQAWDDAIFESQDLHAIGDQSSPAGYIALVYADGDDIGTLIQQVINIQGLDGYSKLSDILHDAAVSATAHAIQAAYPDPPPLQRVPQREELQRCLPFEIITIGGDDVLLICTAEKALDIACTLSKTFTTTVNQALRTELGISEDVATSLSVGVIIAHTNHPIVNLEKRGRELLKSAKRKRKLVEQLRKKTEGEHIHEEGWIDFHIVSTPGLGSIGDIRTNIYTPPGQEETLAYTARPYRCSHLKQVLVQAQKLSQSLAGSKRMQLYDACLRSPNRIAASLEVLRVQARMGEQGRNLLRTLLDLGVGPAYPFTQDELSTLRYVTLLPDILELAELIPTPGTE